MCSQRRLWNQSFRHICIVMPDEGTLASLLPRQEVFQRYECSQNARKGQLLTIYKDSKYQAQCRPVAFGVRPNSQWQACLRHHGLLHSRLIRAPPVPPRELPSCDSRSAPTSSLSRLLLNNIYPQFGVYIPAVRHIARGPGYCIDCSCVGY